MDKFSFSLKNGFDVTITYEPISEIFKRYTITVKHDFSEVVKESNCIDPSVFYSEKEIASRVRIYFAHMYELTKDL
jgi:hypothetical protein